MTRLVPFAVIATATAALLAGPLAAAPAFAASTASAAPGAVLAEGEGSVTWSVAPAGGDGAADRAAFGYAVNPGVEITDTVAVTNAGATPAEFRIYATDAITDFDTGAFGLLSSEETATDLGSWIRTDVDSITLAPGEQARIPFRIAVPSDATPGDHSAGIVASVILTSNDSGQAITLEQRVAARVYLNVAGTMTASVEAAGLVAGYTPSWNPFAGGTGGVDYAVTNTGNARVDVIQHVTFTGPFGIPFGEITPEPVRNLLPGQAAHVAVDQADVPPLLMMFADVRLETAAPTDTLGATGYRAANGTEALPASASEYPAVTASTMTGAISWIILLIVVVLAAGGWLLYRYISWSREQVFRAIDEANAARDAEQSRERELVP